MTLFCSFAGSWATSASGSLDDIPGPDESDDDTSVVLVGADDVGDGSKLSVAILKLLRRLEAMKTFADSRLLVP